MNTWLISMPCTDEDAARRFRSWLLTNGVDVDSIDGRHVLVPTTRLPFVWDVAQAAVDNGFAHDSEASTVAETFIAARSSGG